MITLLADAAAVIPDWRAWLTPENLISVLSTIAAVLGWLGRTKYKRIAEAIIVGVESYRRSGATPAEAKADVAREIKASAEVQGVEALLHPLVKLLTAKKP